MTVEWKLARPQGAGPCGLEHLGRPRHASRPIRHLVTNDVKEVMKCPNIPTFLRRASPGTDLPEVLRLNRLGVNATMSDMVAIGEAAVAIDLSGVDKQ